MIYPDKEFWDLFKSVYGALSCAEAVAIIQLAYMAPPGNYICLGSHRGKDSLAASISLKRGNLYMVDPIYEDAQIAEFVLNTVNPFIEKKKKTPILISDYSYNVIESYAPYSYVFWDSGDHGGEVLHKETKLLKDSMVKGGIIVSHDIGNQFTQQMDAMRELVNTGLFEWVDIEWKRILSFVTDADLENGNSSWHQYPELPHPPNFVGALRRK